MIKLDYPSILKQRIAEGDDMTWQKAFDWLQAQGMTARKAKELLKGLENV